LATSRHTSEDSREVVVPTTTTQSIDSARDDITGRDATHPPTATASSTTNLLSRASHGDPAAWEEIVRRYNKLVFSKVRSFRLQDADAHDAVQATWLRLTENWHRVQYSEHLGGWLAAVASRECLRILYQAKRSPALTDPVAEDIADPSSSPEQQVMDACTTQVVRNLVAELPPRRQTLLRALFTDNPRPYTEVAHITGLPIGSIGPTRARALEQLRRTVDERGLLQAV
jgi:RNA polymerase sigma factor (sigma-70 family)